MNMKNTLKIAAFICATGTLIPMGSFVAGAAAQTNALEILTQKFENLTGKTPIDTYMMQANSNDIYSTLKEIADRR